MKIRRFLLFLLPLMVLEFGWADVPTSFSWVNLETDKATMTAVRHALHDPSISAIREVGVEDGFALVMTTSRENGAPTPDYDRWSIYNISLKTGLSHMLVSGYGVKLIDWVGASGDELAITYYDCWECEAATLFTALRLKKGVGWTARWHNKTQNTDYPQPGAVVLNADSSDNDYEVEHVFAIVAQPKDSFAAGSLDRIRNTKTGKIVDDVERYSMDVITKEDRVEKLDGRAALNWERQICAESNILIRPSTGQDSKTCKSVLRPQIRPHPTPK